MNGQTGHGVSSIPWNIALDTARDNYSHGNEILWGFPWDVPWNSMDFLRDCHWDVGRDIHATPYGIRHRTPNEHP